MKYAEACKKMLGAYELRYWAVFALIVQIGFLFGKIDAEGAVIGLMALGLGGFLARIRLSKEHKESV